MMLKNYYTPILTSNSRYNNIYINAYSKKWIGAGGKTHTIINNVVVPLGATLTIKSGAIVDPNSYSITSTNGTITIESGATINPDIRIRHLGRHPVLLRQQRHNPICEY